MFIIVLYRIGSLEGNRCYGPFDTEDAATRWFTEHYGPDEQVMYEIKMLLPL